MIFIPSFDHLVIPVMKFHAQLKFIFSLDCKISWPDWWRINSIWISSFEYVSHYTGRSLRAREIIIVANYLPYKDAELNLIPTTVIKAENNGLYLKSKPWRGGDNSICGFCGHNVYLHWQTPYPSDRKIRLGAIERESTLSSGPHLHVRS